MLGVWSLTLDLFRFPIKKNLGQPPRFPRRLVRVVNRPFIRRFVSFRGAFSWAIPWACFGGLGRPFVGGFVFNFGLVQVFHFF